MANTQDLLNECFTDIEETEVQHLKDKMRNLISSIAYEQGKIKDATKNIVEYRKDLKELVAPQSCKEEILGGAE